MPNKISKEVHTAYAVGMGMLIGCIDWIERKERDPKAKVNLRDLVAHMAQLMHDVVSGNAAIDFMKEFVQIYEDCGDDKERKALTREYLNRLQAHTKDQLPVLQAFFTSFDLQNLSMSMGLVQQGNLKRILKLSLSYLLSMEGFWNRQWHSSALAEYINAMPVDYSPHYTQELLRPMLRLYRDRNAYAPVRLPFYYEPKTRSVDIDLLTIRGTQNVRFEEFIQTLDAIEELDYLRINAVTFSSKHYYVVTQVLDMLREHKIGALHIELDARPQNKVDLQMLTSLTVVLYRMAQVQKKYVTHNAAPLLDYVTSAGVSLLNDFARQMSAQTSALHFRLGKAELEEQDLDEDNIVGVNTLAPRLD